jgi:hypothetical protein
LAAATQDIALSRFRLLEPHLAQHRSSRQTRESPFGRRNFFWLLRQIASGDLRHSVLTYRHINRLIAIKRQMYGGRFRAAKSEGCLGIRKRSLTLHRKCGRSDLSAVRQQLLVQNAARTLPEIFDSILAAVSRYGSQQDDRPLLVRILG